MKCGICDYPTGAGHSVHCVSFHGPLLRCTSADCARVRPVPDKRGADRRCIHCWSETKREVVK